MARSINVPAIELQEEPRIISAIIPGKWLIEHSTPSWRIKKPKEGFQRMVKEERAKQIAVAVLDQGRSFPNSIVLATNKPSLKQEGCKVALPNDIRFLVVDGQHRLWAQNFSGHEAKYSCIVHLGLTLVDMAKLFLEINDTQKRVPSSLRWDLVRLVRPDDDPHAIEASELVFELSTDPSSPLYQRIDLTGEQPEIDLKQGSIAPELKTIVSTRKGGFRDLDFDKHFESLTRYISAIRSVDPQGWRTGTSVLIKARVLRALLRILPEMVDRIKKPPHSIPVDVYAEYLKKIDLESLAPDQIKALQGSAGIKQIYTLIKEQVGV